jgi:hypothetical protein
LVSHASRPNPAIPSFSDITKAACQPDGSKSIVEQALSRGCSVELIKEMMPGRLSEVMGTDNTATGTDKQ